MCHPYEIFTQHQSIVSLICLEIQCMNNCLMLLSDVVGVPKLFCNESVFSSSLMTSLHPSSLPSLVVIIDYRASSLII